MKRISEAIELLTIGKKLGIDINLLREGEAENFINNTLNFFIPFKITGHRSIDNASIKLPIDEWEFSYMEYLCQEKGYIFFEQETGLSKRTVVVIGNLRLLGKILEQSFGMEYFLTNENMDFLIAVNWYVIEISGKAGETFIKLTG